MTVTAPTPQVARDRHGRPLVIPAKGGKPIAYRRCTTFIDVLEDRFALEAWKQRNVAVGMAARPDLVLKAASANGDKSTLNEVAKEASEAAGSSAAATTGSAVHALTEQIDRGHHPFIPPSAAPDIDAYLQATSQFGMAEIEVFTVNDKLKVGGTFDRILDYAGHRYVADIKTGSIDYGWGKIEMQLAVYAGSNRYEPATGGRHPLDVNLDWGLVIHLPAGQGRCDIWWANLANGRIGIDIAQRVWSWRGHRHQPARQFLPLLAQIEEADSVDALNHLWARHFQVWTEELTAAAAARKNQLIAQGARAEQGAVA